MTDFSAALQQGNAWLFIPSAIALGALHGLEPGHSKTMMAAFIVAIRGTLTQAVLLGLSATLSHTAIVWAVTLAGLYFGHNWDLEASDPYFQVASAVLIVGVAAWMLWRTWRFASPSATASSNPHKRWPNPMNSLPACFWAMKITAMAMTWNSWRTTITMPWKTTTAWMPPPRVTKTRTNWRMPTTSGAVFPTAR